ncbi:unnamed protein product [marine sediment metagenome]|uniref:Uncharacterized protein n=1 Tax=marine sediment metagenome TaxID=412755 RepID=X1FJH7_9ZZZZ
MPAMNVPGIKVSDIWTDYHYYTELAIGANYVPPANTMFSLVHTQTGLKTGGLNIQFYDGAAWIEGSPATPVDQTAVFFQDKAQSLRVVNDSGGAQKISLTGRTMN